MKHYFRICPCQVNVIVGPKKSHETVKSLLASHEW